MGDFDFSVYMIELLYSEKNVIKEMIDVNDKYCCDSEENAEFLSNTLTSYINGDIDESHTQKSIIELVELLEDENKESNNKNKVYDLFNMWNKYYLNISAKDKYIFFEKILSNYKKRSFELTKFIWSNSEFRQQIQYAPHYDNGKDFTEKGIFQTLFTIKDHNYKTQKSLDVTMELANDESIYPHIIKYIHRIIELNESFTATNFVETTSQKKCSHLDFNIFILKFLHKIYKNHFKKNNKGELKNAVDKKNIKNYKIDDLNLSQQIFVTMLYGLHVFLECSYKIYDTARKNPAKTFVHSIKKLVAENWIQDVFIEYFDLRENFGIDDFFVDILHYFDFASAYNKKDNINMNIKGEIYNMISEILGGAVQNVHTRLLAFTIIKASSPETGFTAFENFFDNLFKYINEVSFAKLAFPFLKDKIVHQHALTITLLQMTDLFSDKSMHNNIGTKSRYIFAETLFKLISNSFEIFDIFNDDLYGKIKSNYMEMQHFFGCYMTAIETAIYTLLIYKNLYEKNIINEIYPETEEKYFSFIGRVISNIKMSVGNKFEFNQINSQIEKELISICFEIINKKIDDDKKSNFEILEIKDKILDKIIHVNDRILSPEKKLEIKDKIEKIPEDTTDYPFEFTDPITCKPIKTPVMIPNTNEIFERISIIMQIYSQGTNPYTREPLTLEILEKHNQKEEVIKKIDEFKHEKAKWLDENKK